jgi:hypothetical protein
MFETLHAYCVHLQSVGRFNSICAKGNQRQNSFRRCSDLAHEHFPFFNVLPRSRLWNNDLCMDISCKIEHTSVRTGSRVNTVPDEDDL